MHVEVYTKYALPNDMIIEDLNFHEEGAHHRDAKPRS